MKSRTFFASLFALLGLALPIQGQYLPSSEAFLPWGPIGGVDALARHGDTLFVGGNFTHVGPPTGAVAALDPATGVVTLAAGIAGEVRFIVPDGRGGWFIGGRFSLPTRRNISVLRLNGDGAVDLQWHAPAIEFTRYPSSPPLALAAEVVHDRLFIGGGFDTVQGEPRPGVAALDAVTGALLPWNPGLTAAFAGIPGVSALKHHNGALYIGGQFNGIAGLSRQNLGAVDVRTAQALPFDGRADDFVEGFSILDDTLYVSGSFDALAGQPRRGAAAFTLSTGALKPWAPEINGEVLKILAVAGRVFVGGNAFETVNGQPRKALAALDPDSAALLPFDARLGSDVSSGGPLATGLDVIGSTLYVTGRFREARGQLRHDAAAFDLSSGAVLPWSPMLAGAARTVAASANGVLVGGDTMSAGIVERKGFARIDLISGRALPAVASPEDVTALLSLGEVIVAATPTALEAFRADTMEPLGWRQPLNGRVDALATDGARLFVGGWFSEIAGVPRHYLAAFDLSTGALSPWAPEPNAGVSTIAVDGRVVYVGGEFISFPGYGRGRGAALDARTGDVLSWNPEANGSIQTLAILPTRILLGGSFSRLGEDLREGVGSVDRSQGRALEVGPVAAPVTLKAMGFQVTVILGGSFFAVDGQSRRGLAALSAQSGQLLPWAPDLSSPGLFRNNPFVRALHVSDDALIAGGSFVAVDGRPASHLAVFPIARPGPPRALRATVAGNVATVSWEAGSIPLATSYQVEVGLTYGGSEVGVFPITATQVRGALGAVTYFVRVRGVSSAGAGSSSSEIILTMPASAGPPQPPSALTATVIDHTVTLSWHAASGNAQTYIIELGTAPGLSNLAVYTTGHLDTTLTTAAPPGTYFLRVRAANASGAGGASNEVVVSVP